jgi:hypothetical protein
MLAYAEERVLTTQAVLTFEGKLNHEKLVAAISPLLDDEKTKVKLTAVELLALLHASLGAGSLLLTLLYWHKSTHTDAAVELLALLHASLGAGTQFTCFTGTKVQILAQRSSCLRSSTPLSAHSGCTRIIRRSTYADAC